MKRAAVLAGCAALSTCWWLSSRGTHAPISKQSEAAHPIAVPSAAPPSTKAAMLPATTPPAARAPALLDEAALMAELRRADGQDPELCLVLARDGNARFPDSPDAPERAALAIKSLALTGHLSEARGEAEFMVNHYPPSRWTEQVEQHTGAHRRHAVARQP